MIIWSPGISLEDMEEKIIETAYNHYNRNPERTANSLKISMDLLNEKIKNFSKKQEEVNYTLELEKKKYEEYLKRARGMNKVDLPKINYEYEKTEAEIAKSEIKKRKLID